MAKKAQDLVRENLVTYQIKAFSYLMTTLSWPCNLELFFASCSIVTNDFRFSCLKNIKVPSAPLEREIFCVSEMVGILNIKIWLVIWRRKIWILEIHSLKHCVITIIRMDWGVYPHLAMHNAERLQNVVILGKASAAE